MRFFYTGAESYLTPQPIAKLSLGGNVSSSTVPNDVFSNLFGELSSKTISDDGSEYFMLALKNETGHNIDDVSIYYDYQEDNYAKLEISSVSSMSNDCGDVYFEEIPNKHSRPLNAAFVELNGSENEASLGPVIVGDSIGIWFKRTLTDIGRSSLPTDETSINSCDNVYARFQNNNEKLEKTETISLHINY